MYILYNRAQLCEVGSGIMWREKTQRFREACLSPGIVHFTLHANSSLSVQLPQNGKIKKNFKDFSNKISA